MATNYIQPGKTLTVTAPTGGVASGDGVLIGQLFGVAQHDAAEAERAQLLTEGVLELAKATPLAIRPPAIACSGTPPTSGSTRRQPHRSASASPCWPPPTPMPSCGSSSSPARPPGHDSYRPGA